MTTDYQLLLANKQDQSKLVQIMYDKYKNFIYKKAINNTYYLRSKMDVEDYVSEVYIKLYWYANYINVDKVKESFSFYIYVNNACCDVLTASIKKYRNETCSIDDENKQNSFSCTENALFHLNEQAFYSQLTPFQRKVLMLKQAGKTTVDIQKKLDVSYFLVSKALSQMKEIYNSIF